MLGTEQYVINVAEAGLRTKDLEDPYNLLNKTLERASDLENALNHPTKGLVDQLKYRAASSILPPGDLRDQAVAKEKEYDGRIIIPYGPDLTHPEWQYLEGSYRILTEGFRKEDRTGTGTWDMFGHQMRFNLQEGFPVITTKKLHLRSIVHELLWLLQGGTNIKYLNDNGVSIWDEWADENGNLGPVYGAQWRDWQTPDGRHIDQLADAIHRIETKPHDRRIIVDGWNPGVLPDESLSPKENARIGKQALPPCHLLYHFNVEEDNLDCLMYQRSSDWFLGVPFNIVSYALLTMMVAQVTGLKPRNFIHTFGSWHGYINHEEQINTQLSRVPRPFPTMKLNPDVKHIDDFRYDDFELVDYESYKGIKAAISV